jgi:hypothetical protein
LLKDEMLVKPLGMSVRSFGIHATSISIDIEIVSELELTRGGGDIGRLQFSGHRRRS